MIPKIIHYCWFGRNPKPELVIKCIDSWKKYCPDYEIIEWNEKNYDYTKNQFMREAYREKKWGFVPDYARLDIIYEHGGIYLDTDVEIVKSLDDLLNEKGYAGMEPSGLVNLGLGFGAEPKNPLIKEFMNYYENRSFYIPRGKLIASPNIQTKTLMEHNFKSEDTIQMIDGFKIFSSEYFCPCPYDMDIGKITVASNTYSIHHFMASWVPPLDKIVINISRKFDKRKKSHVLIVWMLTFPFRLIIKIRNDGIKETVKIARKKIVIYSEK